VCAVVVTYNRRELLSECLDRVQGQSRSLDQVLVVDNASTDGTADMLAERRGVKTLQLEENRGAAGGFERGIEWTVERGYDWVWLMDDDTFAEPDTLERLLEALDRAPRQPSLLCSVVRWRDGTLHPMNRPWFRLDRGPEFAEAASVGLGLVRAASWVSTLISRRAILEHGLPPAHFFVWLEDVDYTGRILRDGTGYVVPESVAWHWTPRPSDTITDSRDRFYFYVRNHLWLFRGQSFGGLERLRFIRTYLRGLLGVLRRSDSKLRALMTVGRGVRDGLRHPERWK
jgi:rhamnopyranosyl-N-acetylglucosaminyl-diphospho-decaprenol beta-1,3/1,4-galactofuranosyltransferase